MRLGCWRTVCRYALAVSRAQHIRPIHFWYGLNAEHLGR